jgi:hypothetical protein
VSRAGDERRLAAEPIHLSTLYHRGGALMLRCSR